MGNMDAIQNFSALFGQSITINVAKRLLNMSQNNDSEPHKPQYYMLPKFCLLVFLKHYNSPSFHVFECAIAFNMNVGPYAGWVGVSQWFLSM